LVKEVQLVLFDINKPVNARMANSFVRPTVVGLVGVPYPEHTRLLLVLPRQAERNGWVMPQGGIYQGESPLAACLRELQEECGYHTADFDIASARALWRGVNVVRDRVIKEYYVVGLRLSRMVKPCLNRENRGFLMVGGLNFTWAQVGECSQYKQMLIAASLLAAVREPAVLVGKCWSQERLLSFIGCAGGT